MLSRRPYLIRAVYDWLVDCGELPHVLVEADRNDVVLPGNFVQDGRIVLNIGPDAVSNLALGNDSITFNARFQGKPMSVGFPPEAVIAIYGRDSGQGMMFGPEDDAESGDSTGSGDDSPQLASVESRENADSDGIADEQRDSKRKKRGKPSLKVIK